MPATSLAGRYRHSYLLASLLLLLLGHPFLHDRILGSTLVDVLLAVTMFTALATCASRRRQVVVGSVLAAAMLSLIWSRNFGLFEPPALAIIIPGLLFFAYLTGLLSLRVFRDTSNVSADTIYGAVSIYLLIGVLWMFVYAGLETIEPGSFAGGVTLTTDPTSLFERFAGFSFVTLTTLGYGNITPVTPRADALAFMEAVVGQIFLTVLVARLVGMHISQSITGERGPS